MLQITCRTDSVGCIDCLDTYSIFILSQKFRRFGKFRIDDLRDRWGMLEVGYILPANLQWRQIHWWILSFLSTPLPGDSEMNREVKWRQNAFCGYHWLQMCILGDPLRSSWGSLTLMRPSGMPWRYSWLDPEWTDSISQQNMSQVPDISKSRFTSLDGPKTSDFWLLIRSVPPKSPVLRTRSSRDLKNPRVEASAR
jgi:hypothetical protein